MSISFVEEIYGYQILIKFENESFNDQFINDEEVQNDNGDSMYDKQIQLPFERLIYKSDPLQGQTYDDDYQIIEVGGIEIKKRIKPKCRSILQRGGLAMDCKKLKLIQFEIEALPNYLSWLLNQVKIFPHAFLNLYIYSILQKLSIQSVNKKLRKANVEKIMRKIIIKMADVIKQEQRLAVKKLKLLENIQQQKVKSEQVIILSNFQKSLKKLLKQKRKLIQKANLQANAIGS